MQNMGHLHLTRRNALPVFCAVLDFFSSPKFSVLLNLGEVGGGFLPHFHLIKWGRREGVISANHIIYICCLYNRHINHD
jgi:hypothetical protein